MKIGVKFGPENWEKVLSKVTPQCAEIWFRLDWGRRYQPLFERLQTAGFPYGLHFWAMLPDGFEPNLAYDRDGIAEETLKLMMETIDIAATVGATYVNIHPGSLLLKKLDLDHRSMEVLRGQSVTEDEAKQSLTLRLKKLHEYAAGKNVLFLAETLPINELAHWRDESGRLMVQESQNISPALLADVAGDRLWVTNDFGHTLSSIVSDDRSTIWDHLLRTTKQLAARTRLIHLNTVNPPFNGTDSHNGVLEEDFAGQVLPEKAQLIELLRLFKDRDDVWIIPEPKEEKMADNYKAIEKLVSSL